MPILSKLDFALAVMSSKFTASFDNASFKGSVTIHTGLFINGEWVEPKQKGIIDVINPATGKVIVGISGGTAEDVDIAVKAAKQAYQSSWGTKVPGTERAKLLNKLADLVEQHTDDLAALETLNTGKMFKNSKRFDIGDTVAILRYYAGWADKALQGKTIETHEQKFAYTRHEPIGVCGAIVPWNFPLYLISYKLGPALATGNTLVLKPSELTPLTALKLADLVNEAGFPSGVVNIVNGYGHTVGQAISEHPDIRKIAFTGSGLTGRKIMHASADSNLKRVTLELGGKTPNIIFDDADIDQASKWAAHGIFFNMGQSCVAGSRIYVQESIYDAFLEKFSGIAIEIIAKTGDPFDPINLHGPQMSRRQFDRIMEYIDSGNKEGATLHVGGEAFEGEGYFIKPTIFTECSPSMRIVKEEIFGPVAGLIKFKDEAEVVKLANETSYGLGSAVFSQNINRAIRVGHSIEAGMVWINCATSPENMMPWGGFKESGFGRDLGEYALENYTQVKAVHVNLGMKF